MTTSDSVNDEVIRHFQLYADVRELGQDLLTRTGLFYERKEVLPLVSKRMCAKVLPSTSPLGSYIIAPARSLFYYSFLNFAKR